MVSSKASLVASVLFPARFSVEKLSSHFKVVEGKKMIPTLQTKQNKTLHRNENFNR